MAAADVLQPDVLGRRRSHGADRAPHAPGARGGVRAPPPSASATRSSREAVDPERGSLVADYGGKELDAALLQAVDAAVAAAERPARCTHGRRDPRGPRRTTAGCSATASTTASACPTVAFIVCTFWLVEALAAARPHGEARAVLERACARSVAARPAVGGLSSPSTGGMWGNFPQAYSHVGLIHAAFAASPRWAEFGS